MHDRSKWYLLLELTNSTAETKPVSVTRDKGEREIGSGITQKHIT